MTATHASTLVSVPALRVWVRDRVGPIDCSTCGGRRARVCVSCRGEGGCRCDMDYEHTCRSCRGTGFHKCACTPRIEWEEIPRPLVRLAGIEVSAWDLLDQLSAMRSLVARAEVERGVLHLHARQTAYVLAPPERYEPHKNQPVFDYPTEQLVLPLARA